MSTLCVLAMEMGSRKLLMSLSSFFLSGGYASAFFSKLLATPLVLAT